ncbi:MAG TPA: enoyl-CoA hydratase-related protein [Candidatus Limnocylindrales bacterium]|jgi:2-(1,2-epoxy-1,2-dihydrophenyl)acetyl-CoA isomerase
MATPPAYEALRWAADSGVATITLDRPEALNSLEATLKHDLLRALRDAGRDPEVRVVILTGAGRAFCAGQDLKERLQPDPTPLDVEVRERFNPLVQAIRSMDKPVIAAINGVAAGAGASLAFACDLRIAAETASFVLAFGRIGLVPDSGATWLLPRLIGLGRATELMLLPDPVGAADALRIGLVNRVVPAGELLAAAGVMAAALAAAAPRSLALTKRAIRRSLEATFEESLDYEASLQGIAGRTTDHAEGLAAFVEKRPPSFNGS